MTLLAVPVPQLSWQPPGAPQIEQPVDLRLPAVRYADGAEATAAEAQKVGAYVYRLRSSGEEIWNETEKRWTAAPADLAELMPVPLTYAEGEPLPWQGILIAFKTTDRDGSPRFETATAGEPRYRLRAYARFRREGVDHAGLSAPSSELAFVSGAESQRFVVEMTPPPDESQDTEKVCVQLRNASLAKAGFLEIRAAGGQELEIANCNASGVTLASVLLAADGDIVLRPAPGKGVAIETATGRRYL